jgi:hypothetical protein
MPMPSDLAGKEQLAVKTGCVVAASNVLPLMCRAKSREQASDQGLACETLVHNRPVHSRKSLGE